jgi:hypothetical protein
VHGLRDAPGSGDDDDYPDYYRAGGDLRCERCGKLYYDHPRGGPIGYNGERFLNRLCNGDLVKL